MGFLQRVVNGGGYVDREYGIGRGRIDLLDPLALHRAGRQTPLATRGNRAQGPPSWPDADPTQRGLAQLDGYLDRLDLDHGVLVVFDRRPNAPPVTERTEFAEISSPAGRTITLLRT